MRKAYPIALVTAAVALGGCAQSGLFNRDRPDEFAVARRAPLVIPPDFAMVPPQTGLTRATESTAQTQALQAMFGGPAQRSATERNALQAAGAEEADPGVRSGVGDVETNVIDKGQTTQDIVAAPAGDGQAARVSVPGAETAPPPAPAPAPQQ